MEKASFVVSKVLTFLKDNTKPNTNLVDLNAQAEDLIIKLGATSFNKGYQPTWSKTPFPTAVCMCINNEVAHSFPYREVNGKKIPKILQEGDIVSYDVGVKINGLCGDAALTVSVGKIDSRAERLLYYAKNTLYEGIKMVKAGVTLEEVSASMEKYAMLRGFVINERYTGHGISKEMHEEPTIAHVYIPNNEWNTYILKEGQMICLEPMLTYEDKEGFLQEDGWTSLTQDGRNSAFYEHMIKVTKEGSEILTTHIEA